MTTAYGSTTSSPGTPPTREVPLEEAPFEEYLKILRKEGYEKDAEDAYELYTGILGEAGYEASRIMRTPFKNLVEAAELLLAEQSRTILSAFTPTQVSGTVLKGEGADKLTGEQLDYLLKRQMQLHEEEKLKQGAR